MRACVRACVRAGVRACVRACVRCIPRKVLRAGQISVFEGVHAFASFVRELLAVCIYIWQHIYTQYIGYGILAGISHAK